MERKSVGRDLGLSVRMGVALIVLGILYLPLPIALLMFVLGWTGSWLLAVGALAAVSIFLCFLPSLSERIALAAAHAEPVAREDEPGLYSVVERLVGMADLPMPRNVMQDIATLLSEYAATRERTSDKARRLFEGIDPRNRRAQETLTRIITQWLIVTRWFLKHVHDSGAPDTIDPSELQKQFELFETALGALTREFFKTIGELDAILEKANA